MSNSDHIDGKDLSDPNMAAEAAEGVIEETGASESRRKFLKTIGIGTGAAFAATAAAPFMPESVRGLVTQDAQAQLFGRSGSKYVKLQDFYDQLGKYVLLAPGKFSGTVAATDLSTGWTMAWLAAWNYGDTCPIMHHMAAFPSADPYKEFEFVVNTQGGKNLFIYGVPATVENPGEGMKIYRIKYDGTRMNLQRDAAEISGLGLGVHVTITPDAKGYAVGDGQKDICAEFDRETDMVRHAWHFDWDANVKDLKRAWLDGGTMTIKRLKPTLPGGRYDLQGSKGNKIDWELVPGGELAIEDGKVSGERPLNACANDALVFDPRGKWAAASLRLTGVCVIFDREKQVPVAVLSGPKGTPSQLPMVKVDDDTWTVEIPEVISAGHQAGFSPDGKSFLFMNSLRQNNIMVWDSSNHDDPTSWEKKAVVESPDWRGAYPNTFHMVFTPDSRKMYVTMWWPSPTPNGIAVIDAVNWKVLKEVDLGPDMHTLAMTYDGKFVVGTLSGYQNTASAIVIMETETDEVLGFLPSPMGHHDNVIVPRTLEDLRMSRSTTT